MDACRRAIAFTRVIDERAAEEIVPLRWGRALINLRLNLVHDANYLIVDRPNAADADDLIAEAERIQGRAGLSHRRVNVDDQMAANRLADGFDAGGYAPERFTLMVRERASDRDADHRLVSEVDWQAIRAARELERSRQPWAYPELVGQILARHELTASRIGTRYFAALVDGRVVSSCELRAEAGVAQVETVETLEEFRRRGLARAVVSAALQAADGFDFVFLVADASDWPQHFYHRLGFDEVGIETRFLRLLHPRRARPQTVG